MFGTKRGGMVKIQDSLPNVLIKHLSNILSISVFMEDKEDCIQIRFHHTYKK